MAEKTIVNKQGQILVPDPPIAFALFQTTRFAWLWLIIRVYLGYTWLISGWGKITNPAWQTGGPLRGFWEMQSRSRRLGVQQSPLTGIEVSSSLCLITSGTNGSLT